jgi:ABC-type transporter Mla subunit MlaD
VTEQASYTRLGAFVLTGVALVVAAVVVLGGGLFRQRGVVIETYFDEAVEGLEVGAPVKYRGVRVGSVVEIGLAHDVYPIPITEERFYQEGRYVVVRARLRATGELEAERRRIESRAPRELAAGLRVRLSSNPITGTSFLELDYVDAARSPELPFSWTPEHPYLPSTPSTLAKLGSAATRLIARIDALDIESVVASLRRALDAADDAIADAEIGKLSEEARSTLVDLRQTSRSLRGAVERVDLGAIQARLDGALDQIEALSRGTNVAVGERNEQLGELIRRLSETIANLEEVARTLRASPATILRSSPPPPFDPGRKP